MVVVLCVAVVVVICFIVVFVGCVKDVVVRGFAVVGVPFLKLKLIKI